MLAGNGTIRIRAIAEYKDGYRAVYSPDGLLFATRSVDGSRVSVFDALSGEQKWTVENVSGNLVFSPDSKKLACTSGRGATIFDSENGKVLSSFAGNGNILAIAWSSRNIIATGSGNGSITMWNPDNATCIRTLSGHTGTVDSLSFTSDGTQLASGSHDKSICIWDIASGECIRALTGHTNAVQEVKYSPTNSNILASASEDRSIRFWNTATGTCLHTFENMGRYSISWSPNGRFLASTDGNNNLRIFSIDISSSNACCCFLTQLMDARSVAFSPMGNEILTGHRNGLLQRWLFGGSKDINFGYLRLPPLVQSSNELNIENDVAKSLPAVMEKAKVISHPDGFISQLRLQHELNNPAYTHVAKMVKGSENIAIGMTEIEKQRQSKTIAEANIRMNEDLCDDDTLSFISSMKALNDQLASNQSVVNEYENLAKTLQSYPAIKKYEHPNPRELSNNELHSIIRYSHDRYKKLAEHQKEVFQRAEALSKAIDAYSATCKEDQDNDKEYAEKLSAYLAYLTRSIGEEDKYIEQTKAILNDLQHQLNSSKESMDSFSSLLTDYANIQEQLSQIASNENDLKNAREDLKDYESTRARFLRKNNTQKAVQKTIDGLDELIISTKKSIQELETKVNEDRTKNPQLLDRLQHTKSSIKGFKDIDKHPEYLHTWIHRNKDKLESMNMTTKDFWKSIVGADDDSIGK